MLFNTALRRAPAGIRSFSSTVKPAASEPIIMNRYSRTITQPKAQGASQVGIPRQFRLSVDADVLGNALRYRGCL